MTLVSRPADLASGACPANQRRLPGTTSAGVKAADLGCAGRRASKARMPAGITTRGISAGAISVEAHRG